MSSHSLANPYAKRKRPPENVGDNTATSSSNNNDITGVIVGGSDNKISRTSIHDNNSHHNKYHRHHHRTTPTTNTNNSTVSLKSLSSSPLSWPLVDDDFGGGGGRASFSQAFSLVEDSHHFQQALEESKSKKQQQQQSNSNSPVVAVDDENKKKRTTIMSRTEQEERAQQRAMDAATAATTTTTTMAALLQEYQDNDQLTDREVQAVGASVHASSHVLLVSPKQRGNLVLDCIRNVPTQILRMVPDYMFSPTQCALFLSLKYHSLYPNYIHRRIAELKTDFVLRILLVLVDIQDNAPALRQLNTLAVTNRLTLILAWTVEEAARYLETFKVFQGKDAALIQKRTSNNFGDQVTDFLTACPGINKTDAANLLGQFGSMQKLATQGTPEELALVPGMGQVKVTKLYEAFCKPFSKKAAAQRRKQRTLEQQQQQQQAQRGHTATVHKEGKTDTDDEGGQGG